MTLHKRPNERLLIIIFVIMNITLSDFSVKITHAPSLWSDPDVRSGNPSWGLWPPRWLWGSLQGMGGPVPHGRSAKRLRVEVLSRWQRLRGTGQSNSQSSSLAALLLLLCCCYSWPEAVHTVALRPVTLKYLTPPKQKQFKSKAWLQHFILNSHT